MQEEERRGRNYVNLCFFLSNYMGLRCICIIYLVASVFYSNVPNSNGLAASTRVDANGWRPAASGEPNTYWYDHPQLSQNSSQQQWFTMAGQYHQILDWYEHCSCMTCSHLSTTTTLDSFWLILRKGEGPGITIPHFVELRLCQAQREATRSAHARNEPDSFHIRVIRFTTGKASLAQWFRYHSCGVRGPGFTTRSQSSECINLEK